MPASMIPRSTELARMPKRPSSRPIAWSSASTAAFGATESTSPGGKRLRPAELTKTNDPPPPAFRCGSAVCATWKKPFTSASITSFHTAGSTWLK